MLVCFLEGFLQAEGIAFLARGAMQGWSPLLEQRAWGGLTHCRETAQFDLL